MSLLNRKYVSFLPLVSVLGLVGLPTIAYAQLQPGYVVLETEHVDLGILSEDGSSLELHIHDEDNGVEYATDEALLFVPDAPGVSRFPRPNNPAFDFIGTPVGSPVWILPQSQNTSLLYLGVANEDLRDEPGSAGLFTGVSSFRLVSVTGALGAAAPGNFSVYETDAFSNPVVAFATSDGIDGSDVIDFTTFSHRHFNYAFTGVGIYEVTLEATAQRSTLGGGGILTDRRTYTFGVGTTEAPTVAVVPEAGTLPLVLGAGCSVLGGIILRRRAKK